MDIQDYIKKNWTNEHGLSVMVRRKTDRRKIKLHVWGHNKWDVWGWSKTRLVLRGDARDKTAKYTQIWEGWDSVADITVATYLEDYEPIGD